MKIRYTLFKSPRSFLGLVFCLGLFMTGSLLANSSTNISATLKLMDIVEDTPANDLCSDAIAISLGQEVTGTFIYSSEETQTSDCFSEGPEEPTTLSAGVWYTLMGTGEEVAMLSSYDEGVFLVQVMAGTCEGELVCVGNNNDGPSFTFEAELDQPYLIHISEHFDEAPDAFTFTFSSPSTNTSCEEAVTVVQDESVTGNTLGLGEEANYVFYHFVGTGDPVRITTTANGFSPHGFELYQVVDAEGSFCEQEPEYIENTEQPEFVPGEGDEDEEYIFRQSLVTTVGVDYIILVEPLSEFLDKFVLEIVIPPVNDDCGNAIAITLDQEVTGTLVDAFYETQWSDCPTSLVRGEMGEPEESIVPPTGVWYSFTGTDSEVVFASTFGEGLYMVSVMAGTCESELVCVGSNADGTSLTFQAVLDEPYLIHVAMITDEEIPVQLTRDAFTFTLAEPSTNVFCEDAVTVALDESVVGNTIGLDEEDGDNVYYHFEGTGEEVQFRTTSSGSFPHGITVYEGSCDGEPLEGVENSGVEGQMVSKQNVETELGVNYFIGVSPYEEVGAFVFEILPTTPPVNDKCADAISLSCGDVVTGNTEFATSDDGQAPACGGNSDIGLGVWYSFVGTGEKINLSTCNDDSFDTSLSVYSGSCLTGLVCVAGNDDGLGCPNFSSILSFNAELGVEYLILVDGYNEDDYDEVGEYSLEITCEEIIAPPVNDICADATELNVFEEGAGTPTEGTNIGATSFTGYSDCDDLLTLNDVWYSFNSGYNTSVELTATFETAGYLFYTLYETCGGEVIECVTKYDQGEGPEDEPEPAEILDLVFEELDPNTDYLIQVWNSSEAGTFTLILNDGENEEPELYGDDEIEISRYAPEDEVLAYFEYDDYDDHDQKFEITEGNENGFFQIDETTGELSIADATAFQASETSSFTLTIRLNDQGPGGVYDEQSLTVTVVDDQYPTLADATISRDERVSHLEFDFSYVFEGVSPDEDDVFYSIVDGDEEDVFKINDGNLTLTEYGYFDGFNYELNPQFVLTVRIEETTPLGLSSTATFTINLNDVNDEPVVNDLSYILDLNSPNGTVVGQLNAEEEDADQTHTFEIADGNEDGIFAVNPATGEVTVADAAALLSGGDAQYTLEYRGTDSGAPALMSEVAHLIVQVQGTPMVTVFEIEEDAEQDDVLGQVVFDAGANIDYYQGETEEGFPFYIESDGTIKVADSYVLDFEEQISYQMYISAYNDDTESGVFSGLAITINILDVNEAPELEEQEENYYLSNFAQNGEVVLQVAATDPEGDELTYALVEDERFEIDAATGVVTVKDISKVPFFEESYVILEIEVSDSELEDDMEVYVELVINAYPTLVETTFSVEENVAAGTLIATLSSDDVHEIESFEIVAGNSNNTFVLDQSTGELTTGATAIDYETTSSYELTIAVTDNGPGNLTSEETVSVLVVNVQESVVIADISDKEVTAGVELKFQVEVTTDVSDTPLTYTLDEATKSAGMLVSESGEFSWTPTVDQVGTTSVKVTASDGVNADEQSVSITVIEKVVAGIPVLDKPMLFPNPVVNTFQFEGGQPDELIILDLNGKTLLKFETPQPSYDIGHLETGIYMMKMTRGAKQQYAKLIKE